MEATEENYISKEQYGYPNDNNLIQRSSQKQAMNQKFEDIQSEFCYLNENDIFADNYSLIETEIGQQAELKEQQVENEVRTNRKYKTRCCWSIQKYQRLLYFFRSHSESGTMKRSKMIEISNELGFCLKTIQNKWTEFQFDRSITSIRMLFQNKGENQDFRKRSPSTQFYIQKIHQIIQQNGLLTSEEIASLINQHCKTNKIRLHKKDITPNVVLKNLKIANITYKRVSFTPLGRNSAENIEKRYKYCLQYKQAVKQNKQLYFLDETGISLHMKRLYGWAKPNEQVKLPVPNAKAKIISILCIVGPQGIASWSIYEGTFNKYIFNKVLNKLAQSIEGKAAKQNKMLIMSGALIEGKQQIFQAIKQNSFELLYLPPCSPMLNPVEDFFGKLKYQIRGKSWTNQKELLAAAKDVLNKYTIYDLKPHYQNVGQQIQKGLRKEIM